MAPVFVVASVYHRKAPNWTELTWGDGPGSTRRGNVALALDMAHTFHSAGKPVQLALLGGIVYEDGLTESQAAQKYALEQLEQGPSLHLMEKANLVTGGSNTATDLDDVLALAMSVGATQFDYVVAPFHAPRAAQTVFLKRDPTLSVYLTVAETDLNGGGLSLCVTAEPPHRGDDAQLGMEPHLRRYALEKRSAAAYFNIAKRDTFAQDWDALLTRHGV